MSLSYQAIYPRLKASISRAKGGSVHWSSIKSYMLLSEPPLSFEVRGKRNLTNWINDEFSAEGVSVDRNLVAASKYIHDLAELIWKATNT